MNEKNAINDGICYTDEDTGTNDSKKDSNTESSFCIDSFDFILDPKFICRKCDDMIHFSKLQHISYKKYEMEFRIQNQIILNQVISAIFYKSFEFLTPFANFSINSNYALGNLLKISYVKDKLQEKEKEAIPISFKEMSLFDSRKDDELYISSFNLWTREINIAQTFIPPTAENPFFYLYDHHMPLFFTLFHDLNQVKRSKECSKYEFLTELINDDYKNLSKTAPVIIYKKQNNGFNYSHFLSLDFLDNLSAFKPHVPENKNFIINKECGLIENEYFIFSMIFYIKQYYYSIIFNKSTKQYESYGEKKVCYNTDSTTTNQLLHSNGLVSIIFVCKELIEIYNHTIINFEEIFKSSPYLKEITLFQYNESGNCQQETKTLFDILIEPSAILFDIPDKGYFPMFQTEDYTKSKYMKFSLPIPLFRNPSKKINVKPFVSYYEKYRKDLKLRTFIPKINICKPFDDSKVSDIVGIQNDNCRLCTISNHHITSMYDSLPSTKITYGDGTFVSLNVYDMHQEESKNSKIFWVNFMENNNYVECPALILADHQTFGDDMSVISNLEKNWLSDIGMDRFTNAKRMFGIIYTTKEGKKAIQFSLQNPLLLKQSLNSDALIVNYCI